MPGITAGNKNPECPACKHLLLYKVFADDELVTGVRSTIIATDLLQFLLQLQLTSFPHHELRVGDAAREA